MKSNQLISISVLMAIVICTLKAQIPTELLFTHELELMQTKGEIRTSTASCTYNMIGDYAQALNTYDISVSWGVDTLDIEYSEIVPAIEKIVEVAKNQQIIIISESHLKPQHRIFSRQIIERLSEYGFKHLGMEAIATWSGGDELMIDTELNTRGYPLDVAHFGFYLREPQMGQLVRNAIQNGYTVFGYERSEKIEGKNRDEIQADNVIRYMKEHKVEKLILHCGWHHAIESDRIKGRSSYFLAKYLKNKTGIDPLTIYQDNFTEKIRYNEHPVLKTLNIDEPSVFINEDNEIISITDDIDIEVIHPRTTYKNNRPDWLYESDDYQTYEIDSDSLTMDYPILVKAYLEEEQGKGVPVDVVELKAKWNKKPLVLRKGIYRIVIDNKKQQKSFNITIE